MPPDAAFDASPPLADAGATDATPSDGGPGARHVFVTSKVTAGDMTFGGTRAGGLSAADDECQSEADAAGLAGEFIAFLPVNASVPARQRFDQGTRNIVLPTGSIVAAGFFALFNMGPTIPIAMTAAKAPIASSESVYTGSLKMGAPGADTCTFWSASSASGSYGALSDPASWLEAPAQADVRCVVPRHIYCFER